MLINILCDMLRIFVSSKALSVVYHIKYIVELHELQKVSDGAGFGFVIWLEAKP